jgi:uncharacterized surface protein with fasciclin (FAS1) repeats
MFVLHRSFGRLNWLMALVAAFGLTLGATASAQQAEPEAAEGQLDAGQQTIADLVQEDERFSTLAQALDAAGLTETLQGAGPFTVFAPTNEAFEALPEGELDRLLEPGNQEQLKSILSYHVIDGKVMSEDVTALDGIDTPEGAMVATVEGTEAPLKQADGQLTFADAAVTETDIQASNGVIHVIDAVAMPQGGGAQPEGQETGQDQEQY